MVQYHIPNLLTHLQAYVKPSKPDNDILEAEHTAWIDACCFFDYLRKKAWKDIAIPRVACRMFPGSSLEGLRVTTEYLTLQAFIEQLTDESSNSIQAQKWGNVLKQALVQTLGDTEEPAAEIIKHLTSRVLNAVEYPYRDSLVRDNVYLADSMVKEAVDRESSAAGLTLETYMKGRRDTIGVHPLFNIGRWIYALDISDEVLIHPDIVKIEEQFLDLVSLANDLYSYKKEFFECGAYHNYITVALQDSKTGLLENDRQGAIDYTYRDFCKILNDMEQQKRSLPSFGGSEDAKIAMYIEVMMNVVVGIIQWSLESGRYGHSDVAGTAEAPNWGDVTFDMDPL